MRSHRAAGDPRGDLLDANVWLALAALEHPHHTQELDCWQHHAATRLWLFRVTVLGMVRFLTQPKLMGPAALDPMPAPMANERVADRPDVGVHAAPLACDDALRRLMEPGLPRCLLTGAYLAAFAMLANLSL